MKKALVVLLVLVILVTGLPILMGMSGMPSCPECGPALIAAGCSAAILGAGIVLALALSTRRRKDLSEIIRSLLRGFLLERPPRLA